MQAHGIFTHRFSAGPQHRHTAQSSLNVLRPGHIAQGTHPTGQRRRNNRPVGLRLGGGRNDAAL